MVKLITPYDTGGDIVWKSKNWYPQRRSLKVKTFLYSAVDDEDENVHFEGIRI